MEQTVHNIHLIFKTHLDVGFTNLASEVITQYFEQFIPRAIDTAEMFRNGDPNNRFIWTIGSRLIYDYLEQASFSDRKRLEEAIHAGDICWHGLPFTTHSEFMNKSLFEYGLSLSQELDRRFGKHTIAGKMTDVPGHSRAIVPLLAQYGIEFLHIGVNSVCTPPSVPPIFVWRSNDDSEVIVAYHDNYGGMTTAPGTSSSLFLSYAFSEDDDQDNFGPHSEKQIVKVYEDIRRQFPEAHVFASTLDDFAREIRAIKKELPIIEEEIGDTWIHGIASDPIKVAQFREISRLRSTWQDQNPSLSEEKSFRDFSHQLLLVPEHTWGLDGKKHLRDFENYARSDFEKMRQMPQFKKMEDSWAEQRRYIDQALSALRESRYQEQAHQSIKMLEPTPPSMDGFETIVDPERIFRTELFDIGFNFDHGSIIHLTDRRTNRLWATKEHPLGLFRYQTFSQGDYDRFLAQYHTNSAEWAIPDFSKPGIEAENPESTWWYPESSRLFSKVGEFGYRFILKITMPTEASEKYGCPREVSTEIFIPHTEGSIHLTVQWIEKPTTRLPEAMWYTVSPIVTHPKNWFMDKMGLLVSPLEVIQNGNRSLHAIDKGLRYSDEEYHIEVNSLDAPLVAPGTPSLLNFDNAQPRLEKGFHFNLYNNVWGTNFPLWFGEGAKFRFLIHSKSLTA